MANSDHGLVSACAYQRRGITIQSCPPCPLTFFTLKMSSTSHPARDGDSLLLMHATGHANVRARTARDKQVNRSLSKHLYWVTYATVTSVTHGLAAHRVGSAGCGEALARC